MGHKREKARDTSGRQGIKDTRIKIVFALKRANNRALYERERGAL